jgi:hypothetical protein
VALVLGSLNGATPNYFPFSGDPDPGSRIVVSFDSSAPDLVGDTGFVAGTFRPAGSLAQFADEGAIGDWTLLIEDDTSFDPLGIARFTLDLAVADVNFTVSEPGALPLLAIGIVAIGALKRRRAAQGAAEAAVQGQAARLHA